MHAFLLIAAAAAVAPAPAPAITTIIVDQRRDCDIGRVAQRQREISERTARKLKRELEAKGRRVRIVVLHPGTVVNSEPAPLVVAMGCG